MRIAKSSLHHGEDVSGRDNSAGGGTVTIVPRDFSGRRVTSSAPVLPGSGLNPDSDDDADC